MIVLVKELDSFIKGDGKSFNAGENVYREIDLTTINVNLYSVFNKEIKQNSRILKIFFYYKDENEEDLLIPIPKDLALVNEKFVKAKLKQVKEYSQEEKYILHFDKKEKVKEKEGFIHLEHLRYYILDKEDISLDKDNLIDIKKVDIKAGIKLNRKTRNVETGNLYFQNFVNLEENISLLCEINTSDFKDGIYTIGAESKTFSLQKADIDIEEILRNDGINCNEIKSFIQKNKYFKIILLTPTNYPPEIAGARLVAQLIGKPIVFSGWFNIYDNNKKIDSFPSRLFKLIPVGAVFYYKLEDENKLDEIFEKYWLKPSFFVPEFPYFEKSEDETNPLGFGLSIIGVANIEKEGEFA